MRVDNFISKPEPKSIEKKTIHIVHILDSSGSMNDGQFIAPFPASAGTATETFAGISGFNKAVYAGTNNDVNSAGTFMRIHLFNTKLNNFNNFVNDFSISKSFDKVKVNVGYYKSLQNVKHNPGF